MPIKILTIDDLSGPFVFCDHCGKQITTAADGNCEWRRMMNGSNSAQEQYFTHKACSDGFRAAHPEPQEWTWVCMELTYYPLRLTSNLEIDVNRALETLGLMEGLTQE